MPFTYDPTGTLLDRRYQITGLLGKGGMGSVYEAMPVDLVEPEPAEGEPPPEDGDAGSSSTGNEGVVDMGDGEVTKASGDVTDTGKRSRPMHETSECTNLRSDSQTA